MANRFPLILNNIRFQVNPKNITVTKPLTVADLPTQGGVRYQIWYDAPETIQIAGVSAGDTAYRELLFLKQNYEQSATAGISELFYKTKIYKGFIRSIKVGHTLDEHQRFPYTIEFQLISGQQFNFQDFALEPTGILSRVSNFIEQKVSVPIANAEQGLSNLFGKVI